MIFDMVTNTIFKKVLDGTLEIGSAKKLGGYTAQEVGESGAENIAVYPYYSTTMTENGIKWTDNGDGTVSASGTATGQTNFYLARPRVLKPGTYTFSGCPKGGSLTSYFTAIWFGSAIYGRDLGDGVTFTITEEVTTAVALIVKPGTTVEGLTFKPMLESGKVAHGWKPYHNGGAEDALTLEGFTAKEIGESGARNLIPYPYAETTHVESGITWTDNNGIVTANGTATANSDFRLFNHVDNVSLQAGTYTISGMPEGSATNKYLIYLNWYKDGAFSKVTNFITNTTFTLTEEDVNTYTFRLALRVMSGITINNVTFKPMLEIGKVAHNYIPYNFGNAGTLNGFTVEEVGKSGARNLIPYPYVNTTVTASGIVWTDNEDGTVHAKGTATADTYFNCRNRTEPTPMSVQNGVYTVSGCPDGGSDSTYFVQFGREVDGTYVNYGRDYGDGKTVTVSDNPSKVQIQLCVKSGQTVDITFTPMLERGEIKHDFVPYHFGGAKDAKTVNGVTFYKNFAEIDSAFNNQTPVVDLVAGMVDYSRLSVTVYNGSTTVYPTAVGVLEIDKCYTTASYTSIKFTDRHTGKMWTGIVQNTDFVGWFYVGDGGNADTVDGKHASNFAQRKTIFSGSFNDIKENGVYYLATAVTDKPHSTGGMYVLASPYEDGITQVGLYIPNIKAGPYCVIRSSGTTTVFDLAKTSDLASYAKTSTLTSYAKTSDLASYALLTELAKYLPIDGSIPMSGTSFWLNGGLGGTYADSNALMLRSHSTAKDTANYRGLIIKNANAGISASLVLRDRIKGVNTDYNVHHDGNCTKIAFTEDDTTAPDSTALWAHL